MNNHKRVYRIYKEDKLNLTGNGPHRNIATARRLEKS